MLEESLEGAEAEPSVAARVIAAVCVTGVVLILGEKLPERARIGIALLAPALHEVGRAPLARWLSARGI